MNSPSRPHPIQKNKDLSGTVYQNTTTWSHIIFIHQLQNIIHRWKPLTTLNSWPSVNGNTLYLPTCSSLASLAYSVISFHPSLQYPAKRLPWLFLTSIHRLLDISFGRSSCSGLRMIYEISTSDRCIATTWAYHPSSTENWTKYIILCPPASHSSCSENKLLCPFSTDIAGSIHVLIRLGTCENTWSRALNDLSISGYLK